MRHLVAPELLAHDPPTTAVVLFVDVSGFTAMTERLARAGPDGAEVLSGLLDALFEGTLREVHARGGFVSSFAGDAFTAVFAPASTGSAARARAAADAIVEFFAERPTWPTSAGPCTLGVKVGLAAGAVEVVVSRGEGEAGSVAALRGEAIDAAARAEHRAAVGEVVTGGGLAELPVGDARPTRADLDREAQLAFFPPAVVDARVRGEYRTVATVFLAFPEERVASVVPELVREARRVGGYLNKVDFGDKGALALIVVGAPLAREHSVAKAVELAAALRERIPDVRAAITHGRVYAGFVGGDGRGEYTVLGEDVNLAARILGGAAPGELRLDPEASARAELGWLLAPVGELAFKGMSRPVRVSRVVGRAPERRRAFHGHFVGRDPELATLAAALGVPGEIARVVGAAGVGKSRLVSELQRRLPAVRWLVAPCDETDGRPFHPLRTLFREAIGTTEEAFRERFRGGAPDVDAVLADHEDLAADFVGLPRAGLAALAPDARYRGRVAVLGAWLAAQADRRPVVVVVDDLQWVDPETVEVLTALRTRWPGRPVAILLVSRPGGEAAWTGPDPAAAVVLDVLGAPAVGDWCAARWRGPVEPALVDDLVRRSQGNPFFLEQLAALYEAEQAVAFDEARGAHVLAREVEAVPDDVGDLLVARVDRLPQSLRDAIRAASVIGQEFSGAELDEVAVRAFGRSLPADVIELGLRADLWSLVADGACAFAHALLRQAVYGMQLVADLRTLHGAAADALVARHGDGAPAAADRMAHHAERAGRDADADRWLRIAAKAAADEFENRRALALLEKIASRSRYRPQDPAPAALADAAAVWLGIVTALGRLSRFADAGVWCEHALGVLGDRFPGTSGELLNHRGVLAYRRGDLLGAGRGFEAAAACFETDPEARPDARGRALGNLGAVCWANGDVGGAVAAWETQHREATTDESRVVVLGNLGLAHWKLGAYEDALRRFDEQRELARVLRRRDSEQMALANAGLVWLARGDLAAARASHEASLAICREIGDRHGEADAWLNLGEIAEEEGDRAEARRSYDRGAALHAAVGARDGEQIALGRIARLDLAGGWSDEAADRLDAAQRALDALGVQSERAQLLKSLVDALFAAGHRDRGLARLEESVALAERAGPEERATVAAWAAAHRG